MQKEVCMKKLKWWNNGIFSKRSDVCPGLDFVEGRKSFKRTSPTEETRKKTSDSLKGNTPWNKGKTKVYSQKTLLAMSESKKGCVPWNKNKKTGLNPWNKGLTKETDDKVSEYINKQIGQKRMGNYVCGVEHPNYKEDTPEYNRYRKKVDLLTEKNYVKYKTSINPKSYPRTLCGVEGGYQLDHIISVYEGYKQKIDPEKISDIKNLQMLPWKENLKKSNK